MKTLFKICILLFVLVAGFNNAFAQDKMILRAKPDTLLIKVIEVGTDEIRYRLWPVDESMPVMAENKDRIRKIIFANGSLMKFNEDEFSNIENYTQQKKTAIKFDLLGL